MVIVSRQKLINDIVRYYRNANISVTDEAIIKHLSNLRDKELIDIGLSKNIYGLLENEIIIEKGGTNG